VALLKLVFCSTLAIGSLLLIWFAFGKPWEIKMYKRSVTYGICCKFFICLAIYILWPELNEDSDAALYYLPQTLEFMSWKVPYKDFQSSYSLLFHPLLSVPLLLWRSVGSIVLTMLVAETGMIIIYLRHCSQRNYDNAWRTVFLYCFSPISFYWVAMVGYNGPIISFFWMLGLIMADKRKPILSGISAAFAFLFSKLLAVLAWPTLMFYDRRRWTLRSLPMVLAVIFILGLLLIGVDTLLPIKREFNRYTSGNLWFLISVFIPGFNKSIASGILPIITFAVAFFIFFVKFLKRRFAGNVDNFDTAIAFVATSNLLFFILSKKTFTMYIPMALIFIIHTLTAQNKYPIRHIIPVAFLGAVTTIEPYIGMITDVRHTEYFITIPSIFGLFAIDILMVGCYVYLLFLCFKASIRQH